MVKSKNGGKSCDPHIMGQCIYCLWCKDLFLVGLNFFIREHICHSNLQVFSNVFLVQSPQIYDTPLHIRPLMQMGGKCVAFQSPLRDLAVLRRPSFFFGQLPPSPPASLFHKTNAQLGLGLFCSRCTALELMVSRSESEPSEE